MKRLIDYLSLGLAASVGNDLARAAAEGRRIGRTRWIKRAALAAIREGVAADDQDSLTEFALAYRIGAVEAVRLARIILSDPAVKGRELEALTLIESGADHAEVLAGLRAETPPRPAAGNVVTFGRRADA